MAVFGVVLMIVGFGMAAGAFAIGVSVDTGIEGIGRARVANLDLLFVRELVGILGGFTFVGGTVLFGCGQIRDMIAQRAIIPPDQVVTPWPESAVEPTPSKAAVEIVARGDDEIGETADGQFEYKGRCFESRGSAEAYKKLLEGEYGR